jgi:ATP-binding protein involved in chromosome partitioning
MDGAFFLRHLSGSGWSPSQKINFHSLYLFIFVANTIELETQKILEALQQVPDPKTGRGIVEMNRVKEVKVEGKRINFSLHLPQLEAAEKGALNAACNQVLMEAFGDVDINIHFVNVQNTSKATDSALPQVKNIIAVGSGKGGVGKSTVALNLAVALQKSGAKVGLIDADLYGPSIPTMIGMPTAKPKIETLYGKHKIVPIEAHGLHIMSVGFIIEPQAAIVLRGPRLGGIIKQFLQDVLWPDLDYLILDLPPGTGDIQLTIVQTVAVTGAIMVTTPQQVAVIDAIKAGNMFRLPNVNVPILGVVENMSWFTPAELPDNKYYLFGKGGGKTLAKDMDTMLLGQIPIVEGIREAGDEGKPAFLANNDIINTAFHNLARNMTAQLALRHEMLSPTQKVEIKN